MGDEKDKNVPLVIVKPLAYLKMLKHVLRFGSIVKKKSQMKECMGMLFGKLGDAKGTVKDVIVTDVVEVTHGGHIEVSFEDKDYIAFAEINERYASQGDFNIGWYHSHPGLSVFLSTVDVRNHLGFQTTNSSAIAIVWDHVLLEEKGHNGFESFRLTELGKGQYSDYGAVKTIVEPPDQLDFYKMAIKDTLDLLHAGNPPMFELNELPNVIGDFEPTPIDDEKYKSPSYPTILNVDTAASIGDKTIKSQIIQPISSYLNTWSKEMAQSIKNKGVVINQNFHSLKDIIEKRVKDLQVWFMTQANEVFLDVWEKVDTPLEDQITAVKPMIDKIQGAFPIPDDESSKKDLELSIDELLSKLSQSQSDLNDTISKIAAKGGK
jgi:proteasome lid subunit RPN8/RPN11